MITTFLLSSLLVASPAPQPATQGVLAIRVGRCESVAHGTLEHAVILVEGDKITAIGEDLPIEAGIPILDRPDWVVTPGLVNCYSRLGLSSRAGNQFEPQVLASDELTEVSWVYGKVAEQGVTTLGLVPPGSGITGQSVAIRTKASSVAGLILEDRAYLTLELETNSGSKKALHKGFELVEKHDEKVEKELEKFEKKAKGKKSSKSKKKDEEAEFEAPEPDEKTKPFLDLRDGTLDALVNIRKASDWLHLQDVLEEHLDDDQEVQLHLRCLLRDDIDLYEVKDELGEAGLHVVTTPRITLQVGTRRERNIPAELSAAGAKLAFVPDSDSVDAYGDFLRDVGYLVAQGLSTADAWYAVTLGPATVLGVQDRVGSLDVGMHANLILWDGDPFDPGTEIEAVMLEGEWVHEEDGATE